MLRYHDITTDDMKNGDGLRVVLWMAGCEFDCPGCQNPITHDPDDGLPFGTSALNELLTELDKPYISGLTLSGGDGLYFPRLNEIQDLCMFIKQLYPNKTIWAYTGHSFADLHGLEILNYIDVVVDGPFILSMKDESYPWAGSTNQLVYRKGENGRWKPQISI